MSTQNSRRSFLKFGMATAAALPLLKLGKAQAAAPAAKSADAVLEESDPTAKALGYVKDATKVDKAKWPKFKADPAQRCKSCQLYTLVSGAGKDELGKCTLFLAPKTRLVHGEGWCNSWVKKQG